MTRALRPDIALQLAALKALGAVPALAALVPGALPGLVAAVERLRDDLVVDAAGLAAPAYAAQGPDRGAKLLALLAAADWAIDVSVHGFAGAAERQRALAALAAALKAAAEATALQPQAPQLQPQPPHARAMPGAAAGAPHRWQERADING